MNTMLTSELTLVSGQVFRVFVQLATGKIYGLMVGVTIYSISAFPLKHE